MLTTNASRIKRIAPCSFLSLRLLAMTGLDGAPAIFPVAIVPGELPPQENPCVVLPES